MQQRIWMKIRDSDELEGDRYHGMEGRKEGIQLKEPEKIRRRLGVEVIIVARNPLGTVPNTPLDYEPG